MGIVQFHRNAKSFVAVSRDDDSTDHHNPKARPRLYRCCHPRTPRAGTTHVAWLVVVGAATWSYGSVRQLVPGEGSPERVQRAQADRPAPRTRSTGGAI